MAISRFNSVYEQELEDAYTLFVTPVGAYSLSSLMDRATDHLSDRAQSLITKEVSADFMRAGECLALDLATASGFHAMRAVEAQARRYHQIVTGVKEPLSDVPLGPVVNGIKGSFPGLRTQWEGEGSKNDSELGIIISMLSQINKLYRCPIMHPEMVLDNQQAKRIFDLTAIAVSAMVDDGEKRETAKVLISQPSSVP